MCKLKSPLRSSVSRYMASPSTMKVNNPTQCATQQLSEDQGPTADCLLNVQVSTDRGERSIGKLDAVYAQHESSSRRFSKLKLPLQTTTYSNSSQRYWVGITPIH